MYDYLFCHWSSYELFEEVQNAEHDSEYENKHCLNKLMLVKYVLKFFSIGRGINWKIK